MEEQFRALLMGSASVSAIVGSKIDFGRRAEGASLPAIVLNTASDVGSHHLNGANVMVEARVQVDCYANDYGTAKRLHRAVREQIDGHKDDNFLAIFFQAARDNDEGGTDEATRPYRVSADYLTFWSATNA